MSMTKNAQLLREMLASVGITDRESVTMGALVDGVNRVAVPGTTDEIYVSLGDTRSWERVKRGSANVSDEYGRKLVIGRVANAPYREVIGLDYGRSSGATSSGGTATTSGTIPHAAQHQMGVTWRTQPQANSVGDPVFLPSRQIADLLIIPYSGMQLAVMGGDAVVNDTRLRFGGGLLEDMTAEVPASAGEACIARVEMDSDGTLYVSYGSDYGEPVTDAAALANAPAATAGRNTLGFVWIPNGVTALTWYHILPAPLGERTGGAAGGGVSGVTPGTYTNATVTVDAAGRVTDAASGSGDSSLPALAFIPYKIYDNTLGSNGAWDVQEGDLLSGAGAFADYLWLDLMLLDARSTATGTGDVIYLLYGTGGGALDATAANYGTQQMGGGGATVTAAREDTPRIGNVAAASSPANTKTNLSFRVFNPGGSSYKTALTSQGYRQDATNHAIRLVAHEWENTGVIDRIGVRTDNHPTDTFVAGSRLVIIGYK